jgi:hypothetical protein
MITKVEITNRRGNILTLDMEEGNNPYVVKSIQGLEPVKAALISSSYAGNDGEVFQSAKRGPRNIVIKLDLDPDFINNTFTSLRQGLYPFFIPKSQIQLRFYTDTGLYVDIPGVCESFGSPLFEKSPSVDMSIMCHQPDFIDSRVVEVEGVSVDDNTATVLDYPGTVETGTVVTLNLNRPLTGFTIFNMDEGGNILQLDFTGTLLDEDILKISSVKGDKGITLTRSAISSSYLYGRSAQSNWIELSEGLNNFWVYAPGDPIPYVLEYAVRYGGL